MERQGLEARQGEIRFRRILSEQQVEGKPGIPDEYDGAGIRAVLADRMAHTRSVMESLRARGVPLSPYLEIGAERGQRALVLENDFDSRGAAADLSFDMLASTAHYAREFGCARLPLRIVCDVYALPFLSGTLPFVFCFETLHHFPEPGPVVRELHRVLAPGGTFYFDEEPFNQALRLPLFKGSKAYSHGHRNASLLRRVVERFFAEPSCNETEFGILENHSIPLSTWRKAFEPFAEADVIVQSSRGLRHPLFGARDPLATSLSFLLGGSVYGVCRKAGSGPSVQRIEDALACPGCRVRGTEAALTWDGTAAGCAACGVRYRSKDGVLFLLDDKSLRELYPEMVGPEMVGPEVVGPEVVGTALPAAAPYPALAGAGTADSPLPLESSSVRNASR